MQHIAGMLLAAALGVADESWVMTIQVCQGPSAYGEAVRKGLFPGRLNCRYFYYTGIVGVQDPMIFPSRDACLNEEVGDTDPGFHFGDRKCLRLD